MRCRWFCRRRRHGWLLIFHDASEPEGLPTSTSMGTAGAHEGACPREGKRRHRLPWQHSFLKTSDWHFLGRQEVRTGRHRGHSLPMPSLPHLPGLSASWTSLAQPFLFHSHQQSCPGGVGGESNQLLLSPSYQPAHGTLKSSNNKPSKVRMLQRWRSWFQSKNK